MRVLAIETSTRRGSVALFEDERVVGCAEHDRPNEHAERILPLIDRVFAGAGWPRSSIDRIGVGIGPGAFTGIRVGIALGQGIALGLGRPVFGVGSLEAMAFAVPSERIGLRLALLDARREEVFVAGYDESGGERFAPLAIARAAAADKLAGLGPAIVVGEVASELGIADVFRSSATDLPYAVAVAQIAARRTADAAKAVPEYVRDSGAARPNLPPSPFSK